MKYTVSDANLKSVADAIRTKGSTSEDLTFPDGFVEAIGNISGGGGSTLITKSISANGTYNASSDNADGYSSVTVAVPSRVAIGTFTGSTAEKGTAKSISVPYTGSGYPVAGIIFPSAGAYNSESDFYSAVQRYAVNKFTFAKSNTSVAPDYSSNTEKNWTFVTVDFKGSDSSATTYTRNGYGDTQTYNSSADASASAVMCARFQSATTMSVFIANTSYGFMAGVEYTYMIIYSS